MLWSMAGWTLVGLEGTGVLVVGRGMAVEEGGGVVGGGGEGMKIWMG